jgi:hypothetical protein
MDLAPLYLAIDAKPFRPFVLSLTSGERFEVARPDNIFVLPSRHNVHNIQIYGTAGGEDVLIFPEALAALHFNGESTRLS